MTDTNQDELIADAINNLTEKVSVMLLEEFLKLPQEMQITFVLVKSAQLLLANILCHVANDKEELDKIMDEQASDMKELTLNCAYSGFADKFEMNKH